MKCFCTLFKKCLSNVIGNRVIKSNLLEKTVIFSFEIKKSEIKKN